MYVHLFLQASQEGAWSNKDAKFKQEDKLYKDVYIKDKKVIKDKSNIVPY